ncbi:NAD-dependent epimerase/dehydratase family protein [Lewinella sp. JB7]|uniref:NAD-dependent epimerase/dehydratase family protein n=1 Tax=Lewinella sp. JB7 TaxID=2962887 RepID=UPI0020C97E89|nr:NAD-dependent epimerase/dehydratase family protein [Lewinella sp. JB7]MCP9237295.1 NAD(P)H-binding protein [Lewinella sp. JB7]
MEIVASKKTALLLGATGLVGQHVLEGLLNHGAYRKVVAPTRRRLHRDHDKLENPLIDFSKLDRYADLFRCHDVFITLGTTIKKAGSEEAFRRVDHDYILQGARLAQARGANQCLLVSAAAADSESRFFYNRVKGETEEAITRIDFWAIHIFRPGVLVGDRDETRIGERVAAGITTLLRSISPGLLGDYNPTNADVLATRMIEAAQNISPGVHFHGARELV